jgi:CspA family cold shock protein
VKFFNKEKNYGFITPEEGGTDFFFHGSKVISEVKDGDPVEFEVIE